MKTILLAFLIIFSTMNFKEKDVSTPLHYLVKHPKIENEQTPLLIMLHGVGSNEKDLFSFADQFPENFMVISARAPFEVGPDSYAWYEVGFSAGKPVINKEKAEKSRILILQFIDQLKEKYKFDNKQVYLCGFSQGAIMSYSVGLTSPDKIKGIAVMSGRLLEEVKPLIKPGAQLKKLNVFISHGTKDNVLGVHYAQGSNSYLKELGVISTYKEYPEGHTISNAMIADLIKWLAKK
ncbi:MAG: esterase [Bacteroidota bacterium]